MLPSVDSLLACRLMADPARGYPTGMPVSTLLWMLLLPALLTFFPADTSAADRDRLCHATAAVLFSAGLTWGVISYQAPRVEYPLSVIEFSISTW